VSMRGNCAGRCCDCSFFSDAFTSGAFLAQKYDQTAGSWSVASGTLTTSSGSALIIARRTVPPELTGVYCTVTMAMGRAGDVGKLIIAYTDADNYWWCELEPGTNHGRLRLYERSGGAETLKGTIKIAFLQANEQLTVEMCYADGFVRAHAFGDGGMSAALQSAATITIAGTKCGMGTGNVSSGVVFDSFLIETHETDDSECESCATGCLVFGDDFQTDELALDWSSVAGSWAIIGGVLATSSTSALLVTFDQSLTNHGYVTVLVSATANGTKLRVVGAYDGTNYLYGELTINGASSTLKLFSSSGGADTQLGDTISITAVTNLVSRLTLCWTGEEAAVTWAANQFFIVGESVVAATSITGPKAGVACTLTSGSASFNDFEFYRHAVDDDGCAACGEPVRSCDDTPGYTSICEDEQVTDYLRVTVDASLNGSAACSSQCSEIINGSKIIPLVHIALGIPYFNQTRDNLDFMEWGSSGVFYQIDGNQCIYGWSKVFNTSICTPPNGAQYQFSIECWKTFDGWLVLGNLHFNGSGVDAGDYYFASAPLEEPVNCVADLDGVVLNHTSTAVDSDCVTSMNSLTINVPEA
jgi:hypothetical protein